MGSGRVVWSGYKPFYENAEADSKPYNPVEIMGYLSFSGPSWIIRGIGATVTKDNLTTVALWTAEIQEDGTLGPDKGPMTFGGTDIGAQVVMPEGMVAVAWGMKVSDGEISNLVVWGRKWNPETRLLDEIAVSYSTGGDTKVEMTTPVSPDPQQIIVGIGGGVKKDKVNRIAAGYATLAPSPSLSIVPVVWGTVSETGEPSNGRNYSSKKIDKGIYQLTFHNTPPDVVPVVGLTSGRRSSKDNGSDNVFSFKDVTATGCTVYSVDVGQSKRKAQDEIFSFVAFFPVAEIPGLLFGAVDKDGNKINGSEGWTVSRSKKGHYKLSFDPEMDPLPNLIMTSGMRDDEEDGSDDIISNNLPDSDGVKVYSLDVGDGSAKSQDEVFSFFAWNLKVLPMDPIANSMKLVARHRILPDGQLDVVDKRMVKKDKKPSTYYVPDEKGSGHWKINFNFPIPEVPVIFASAVKNESGEGDGAKRIISYQNASTTSYEIWSTKVGDGSRKSSDGNLEITVAMPDQFPI